MEYIQGYYFGRPMSARQFEDRLKEQADTALVHLNQSFLFHALQLPCHGAAVNGKVIGQVHHGKGETEGGGFGLGGQLHEVAYELLADGALGQDLHPAA